jgi:hypothetical protein
VPPLDQGAPGGNSRAKLCLILGVSLQIPQLVSPTGGADPSVCSRGVWSPRLEWREGRVADSWSSGKFVYSIHLVFYVSLLVCGFYLYFPISTGLAPIVPTSIEGRVGKLTYAWPPLGRLVHIVQLVFCILLFRCALYLYVLFQRA